jgi:hypothetical protein
MSLMFCVRQKESRLEFPLLSPSFHLFPQASCVTSQHTRHEPLYSPLVAIPNRQPHGAAGKKHGTGGPRWLLTRLLVDVHPPTANATVPKRTSAYLSTRLTNRCSGDTDATNSCPKGTAAKGDLSY